MATEPIAARHDEVVERLTGAAGEDERVVAAWLQGSRADGSADPFSDIDLYLAVSDEAYGSFDKLAFIEHAARVLVHAELPPLNALVCLLEGPVKLDLFVERASSAPAVSRPAVKMLLDKSGITLRTGWQPEETEVARRVDSLVRTTLQGASWPVRLLRREQWMTHAYSELMLIHNVAVPLMLIQDDARAFHRNALTRERLLPSGQRIEIDNLANEVLQALAARSLNDALQAHLAVLQTLGRAGRAACAKFGLEYPEAAEQEAKRFYEREWPR